MVIKKTYRSVPNTRNTYGHLDLPEEILDIKKHEHQIVAICKKYNYVIRKHRGKMIARRTEKDAKE